MSNKGDARIIKEATITVTGVATEATLEQIRDNTANLDIPLSDLTTPVVSGSVSVTNFPPAGLTDAELRATPVPVSGTFYPATQPISAVSLPLPTGAATDTKQDTGNTSLASIDSKTPTLVSGRQPVDGSGVTQPISAVSLPLPTGASQEHTTANSPSSVRLTDGSSFYAAGTETTLALIKAKTDNIDVALSTRTKPADTQIVKAKNIPSWDSGNRVSIVLQSGTAGNTNETLFLTNIIIDGVLFSTSLGYIITSGKTLRLQAFSMVMRTTGNNIQRSILRLRYSPDGDPSFSNPNSVVLAVIGAGNSVGTIGATANMSLTFPPDGLEIRGDGTAAIGVSHQDSATGIVSEFSLIGYEY